MEINSLTIESANKFRITQRAIERMMFEICLKDHIANTEVQKSSVDRPQKRCLYDLKSKVSESWCSKQGNLQDKSGGRRKIKYEDLLKEEYKSSLYM